MGFTAFAGTAVKFYNDFGNSVEAKIEQNKIIFETCENSVSISNTNITIEIQVEGDNYKVLVNNLEKYNQECEKFITEKMSEGNIKRIEFTAAVPDEACGNYPFTSIKLSYNCYITKKFSYRYLLVIIN